MKVVPTKKIEKLSDGRLLLECQTFDGSKLYVEATTSRCDRICCEDNINNECCIYNISKRNMPSCQEIFLD